MSCRFWRAPVPGDAVAVARAGERAGRVVVEGVGGVVRRAMELAASKRARSLAKRLLVYPQSTFVTNV